ncbi:MAG TPA: hypothetical protein VKU82_13660, partial [Planctomycetaceae bacterium]|nr:hypothetical protein [Planctomycetaceae bacterium]
EENGLTLVRMAQERVAERYGRELDRVQPLLDRWRRRELDDDRAIDELLRLLIDVPESRFESQSL